MSRRACNFADGMIHSYGQVHNEKTPKSLSFHDLLNFIQREHLLSDKIVSGEVLSLFFKLHNPNRPFEFPNHGESIGQINLAKFLFLFF